MIISTKYLPRDLRIIGGIAFLFAFLQLPGVGREEKLIYVALFITYLSVGVIYFSLATGVSRKERWAWLSGLIILILSIISGIISFLSKWASPFYFIVSLLIPVLLLIVFLQAKKEIAIQRKISIIPFIFFIIGFAMNVISTGYLFYLLK
jgi:hypothetical protein